MVKIIFLMILTLFISCNSGDNSLNHKTDTDETTDIHEESTDEDTPLQDPQCFSEKWEKTKIVDDYRELYGFEIEKSEEKWSWEKDGNIESMYIDGPLYDRFYDIQTAQNGEIYIAGVFSDNDSTESDLKRGFLNIYKSDGTLIRHSFKKDGQKVTSIYLDEEENILYAIFVVESKEKSFSSDSNIKKSLIGILDDGTWTFKAWNFSGWTHCFQLRKVGDRFGMLCSYMRDAENIPYTSFQVVDKDVVYRRVFSNDESEDNPFLYVLLSGVSDGTFPFLSSPPVELGMDKSIHTFDPETLCIERISTYENDFMAHITSLKKTDDSLIAIGGKPEDYYYKDDDITASIYLGQISAQKESGERRDILLGIRGGDTFTLAPYPALMLGSAEKSDGVIYAQGISKFDVEFLGREWGACPEGEECSYTWGWDPCIIALKGDDVYARQLVTVVDGAQYTDMRIRGEYIYLIGNYTKTWKALGPGDSLKYSIFIHRIPKSWIVQDDAKADDKLILLDETSN